jgi:hypothetical protein
MVVAGATLIPVGIVVGAAMWALAFACGDDDCVTVNLVSWPIAGASMLTTGIVLLAAAPDAPADANRVEIIGRSGPRFSPPLPGVRVQF